MIVICSVSRMLRTKECNFFQLGAISSKLSDNNLISITLYVQENKQYV